MSTSSSEAIRPAPTIKADGAGSTACTRPNDLTPGRARLLHRQPRHPAVLRQRLRDSTSGTFAIGTGITVTDPTSGQVIFTGEVTSVSLEQTPTYVPELVIVADDQLHRLARTSLTKTYLKMKSSDVIAKLAEQAAGLQVEVAARRYLRLPDPGRHRALGSLDQLSTRAGLVWWCEYPRKLKFAYAGRRQGDGGALRPRRPRVRDADFSVRASARNISSVTVTGWDLKQTQKIDGYGPPRTAPESDFVDLADTKSTFGAAKLTALRPRAAHRGRGDDAGDGAQQGRVLAGGHRARLRSRQRRPQAGGLGEGDERRSGLTARTSSPRSSTATPYRVRRPASSPARSAARVSWTCWRRRPPSPASGSTRGHGGRHQHRRPRRASGRIKVKYPVAGRASQSRSGRAWSRVGGGAKRGATFLPEVNDEVLVAFERGDTRRPVSSAACLQQQEQPSRARTRWTTARSRSRRLTSRLGHVVELSDGAARSTC